MALFALGNKKLPKKIAIFNLPYLLTCPNATELCKEICYSKKSEYGFYKYTKPSRMKNFNLSTRHDFPDILIKGIKKSKRDIMRMHESGDFYSQAYLDKWFMVANYFPTKTFYAYTKSKLDYSKKPKNVILYFSIDESTDVQDYVWYMNNPYKNGIAEINNERANCPANCKVCDRCYTPEKASDVIFRRH